MILRRITEHVKAQNWTAIAIEFVLLVAGVFLGIQVANWNEERQFRGQERELLHAEFAAAELGAIEWVLQVWLCRTLTIGAASAASAGKPVRVAWQPWRGAHSARHGGAACNVMWRRCTDTFAEKRRIPDVGET